MNIFKKRERFDRTDVPVEGPHQRTIGIVACCVALGLTCLALLWSYNRAQIESHLGEAHWRKSLKSQNLKYPVPDGYTTTTDECLVYLIIETDHPSLKTIAPRELKIFVVNKITHEARLGTIPLDMKMTVGDKSGSAAQLIEESGVKSAIKALASATSIRFSHVIVCKSFDAEALKVIAQTNPKDVFDQHTGLVASMYTDMKPEVLVELAQELTQTNFDPATSVQGELYPETSKNEKGELVQTGYQVLDKAKFNVGLGLIRPGR